MTLNLLFTHFCFGTDVGVGQAFKKVGEAFSVLSDADKRRVIVKRRGQHDDSPLFRQAEVRHLWS